MKPCLGFLPSGYKGWRAGTTTLYAIGLNLATDTLLFEIYEGNILLGG
jgi:hypothetical protein